MKHFTNYLILIAVFLFVSCSRDILHSYLPKDAGTIYGRVTDLSGSPLSGVTVSMDDLNSATNSDGYYILSDAPAADSMVISFKLVGYAPNHKKCLVPQDDSVRLWAVLSTLGTTTSINASVDNTVAFQGAHVKLLANGLEDEDGKAYSGTAEVQATWFDPTHAGFTGAFPGNFSGQNLSGSTVALESFGFITVEISNGTAALQLKPGTNAEISMPIPQSILGRAPDPIPLWYFDEEKGNWIQEGSASIQNGQYVGQVSHFSSWNADSPISISKITGRVVKANGAPQEGADVSALGIDYIGLEWDITDSGGRFTLMVKSDATARIHATTYTPPPISIVLCESDFITVQTPPARQTKDIGDVILKCQDTIARTNRYYDAFPGYAGIATYAVGVGGGVLFYDMTGGGWKPVPAGTDATLFGIYMSGYGFRHGWIVGSNGTVRESQDIGQSWSTRAIGTTQDLFDVEFAGPFSGLIVGSVGTIFLTLDGGAGWSSKTSGTVQDLRDADFISLQKAWAVGTRGTIVHSADGGQSWNQQVSGTVENLSGVAFINENNGFVVGDNGTLLKTSNSGQSWQRENSGTLEDLHGIDFAHASFGKIVGKNGTILTTENGGQNWTITHETPPNNIESVRFGGMASGVIAGDDVLIRILTSGNYPPGTAGWVAQNDGVNSALNDLAVVSATEAWVAGDQGVLLHTTNGGMVWSSVSVGSGENFQALEIRGSNIWLAGGNETILHSANDGVTWQTVNSNPGGKPARKIRFVDGSKGWALFSDSLGGTMLSSNNGGLSWAPLGNLPTSQADYFADFEFVDAFTGFLTGKQKSSDNDYLFKTTDAGLSWQEITGVTKVGSDFYDLFFLTPEVGWCASMDDYCVVTSDGGSNWYDQLHNLARTPMKVFFLDYLNGWGVTKNDAANSYTSNGEVAVTRTIDGGQTWYFQTTGTGNFPPGLRDVEMANDKVGWAIGGSTGFIYYTNTGGD